MYLLKRFYPDGSLFPLGRVDEVYEKRLQLYKSKKLVKGGGGGITLVQKYIKD